MTVSSYNLAPGESNDSLAMKRKIALALMQSGLDNSKVEHWTQGAANMLNAGLGGYDLGKLDREDRAERAKGNELMAAVLAGAMSGQTPAGTPPQAQGAPAPAPSPVVAALGGKAGGLPMTDAGPPVVSPRPEVMPSAKVWGDKEAEEAGLYEPSRPMPPQAAPMQPPQGGPKGQILAQLLGNRYTAPMGQSIASGIIGQQFKPQDYDIHHRGDGTVVAVNKKNPQDIRVVQQPGAANSMVDYEARKAGATKRAELEAARAVAEPDKKKQEQQVGNIVTQDIDRTLAKITATPGRTTGTIGQILSGIGGTEAHNVSKLLDTVKSNAGFQELQKMRQASPTGGALGSVTERELALLQSTIGNLEQSQDDKQLADNLRRVKNVYLDIIHGPGNGPAREKLTFQEKPSGAPSGVDPAALEEARRRGLIK